MDTHQSELLPRYGSVSSVPSYHPCISALVQDGEGGGGGGGGGGAANPRRMDIAVCSLDGNFDSIVACEQLWRNLTSREHQ